MVPEIKKELMNLFSGKFTVFRMGGTNRGIWSDNGYMADQVTKYCFQRTGIF